MDTGDLRYESVLVLYEGRVLVLLAPYRCWRVRGYEVVWSTDAAGRCVEPAPEQRRRPY